MASVPSSADQDADGLTDSVEKLLGTDPVISDSDSNGVADGDEDHDHNGIPNASEPWVHIQN